MNEIAKVAVLSDPDAKILADSLHDLDTGGGWEYGSRDKAGEFQPMEPCLPSPGEWVGDMFMVSPDNFALFARDTVHVGYDLAPTLRFTAPRALRAELLVRASLVLATKNRTRVEVRLGQHLLGECEYGYGKVATISGMLDMQQGESLTVSFRRVETINHLVALFHSVLADFGDATGEPPTVKVDLFEDPAWEALRARLRADAVVELDPALVADAAHRLFMPLGAAPPPASWKPAQRYDQENFGAFREPNFFSPRRAQKGQGA